jgi:hypothetical protein
MLPLILADVGLGELLDFPRTNLYRAASAWSGCVSQRPCKPARDVIGPRPFLCPRFMRHDFKRFCDAFMYHVSIMIAKAYGKNC